MKKCKKVAVLAAVAGITVTTVALGSIPVQAASQGYVTVKTNSGNKKQYIGTNGKPYVGFHYMAKNEGAKTPHYEFFDSKGYQVTNWRYLTKADGEKTPHWSYFGSNGWLRTNWQNMGTKANPDGKNKQHFSYFGPNGWLRTGWQTMGTKNNPDGKNKQHVSYFGADGWLRIGWQTMGTGKNPDGKNKQHVSYFGSDGWLRTGWQSMGTSKNPDGKNKQHYSYFGNNGWLRTGWQRMGTKDNPDNNNKQHWSYFGNDGWLRTGWQTMGTGKNPDGKNKQHVSYFGNDGWMRTGWQRMGTTTNPDGSNKEHWSYFGGDGWLRTGTQIIDGQYYRFDSRGWLITGEPSLGRIKDGCYTITPVSNSNLRLDVPGATTSDGARIYTYTSNGSFAQKYQIKHIANEIYTIKTATTIYGSALTVDGAVSAGTPITQKWYRDGADNQRWKAVARDNGSYSFESLDGKYVFDVAGGSLKLAKYTGSSTQKFKLTKTSGYMVRNNRKYYFNSNGQEPMIGIDVSKHNDKIDWRKVKADGISFAIIRSNYGSESHWEQRTVENIKGCIENGIPFGIYFYSIATTNAEADKEVALCKRIIGNYKPELGVFVDIEDTTRYEKAFGNIYSASARRKITDLTKRMVKSLQSSGYRVGVYGNANYFNSILYKNELPDVLWGAHYFRNPNSNPEGLRSDETDWYLWQYSETGRVNGIYGNVDMNTLIVKYW